jgi:hypothetical protein
MRKVMLLAAMLAMVLAAAAPALAQVTVAGDDNTAAQYVDCSQVQAALGVQYGDDSAAVDESIAGAADELGITQNQVNACLGEVSDVNQGEDAVGDIVVDEDGSVVAVEDDGSASAASEGSASAASEGSASAATETLPETGGASLLALGAGALLVAGGLLARRIVR